MEFIDLNKQYHLYKNEINSRIQNVLDKGQYIMGEDIKILETTLAKFVGVKHCITASSGTDTLMMALMALGIGPGDEVITVSFTWISTVEVIALVGATPVLVDIEPDTYNIDLNLLEKAITPRTKAIMPVCLFGQMPDFDRINAIAKKHNIPVIEDAAQSFGATQKGRQSCSVSTIGSTSFYPAKPFGCYGDGGALFTNDDALASKMRAIRTHGGEVRHQHDYVGINGRFDTIQAAVLLAKWPHFAGEVRERQRIGERYSRLLQDYCTVPKIANGNTSTYAQYTIRVPARDAVQAELKARSIPTAIYYPKCVHEQPAFAYLGYGKGSLPVSEKASKEVLSLPMHPWLTESDQDKVIAAVKEAVTAKV
jgi:UDP-2-acetamido-2-deoxy-ribo-hexuluronate aminotransferase